MKCIIIHEITDKTMKVLNREKISFSVEGHNTIVVHGNIHNPKSCAELVNGIGFEELTVEDGKLVNNYNPYSSHNILKPNLLNITTCIDLLKANANDKWTKCCTYPDCEECKFKDQIKPMQWR